MLNAIVLKCCSNNKINCWNLNFSTRDFQNVVQFFFQVPIALHCHNYTTSSVVTTFFFLLLFFSSHPQLSLSMAMLSFWFKEQCK